MAGKGEKICIQRLYVDRHMRNALGAVHNDNGSHAVRHLRDFLDRIHAAEHIRYLRNSHKTCSLINALLKRLICQLALTGTFQIMELRPSHTRHHLPRKQIAVMLHDCYSDLVAFL